uniref:PDZ domain-containing protein n=1 Tax=Noctiluca scintillans TaxID=2966 RepID=A0A7S1FF70_NOCSC
MGSSEGGLASVRGWSQTMEILMGRSSGHDHREIALGPDDDFEAGVESVLDAIEQADRNDEFGDLMNFLSPQKSRPPQMSEMMRWLEHADLGKEAGNDERTGTFGSPLATPPMQERRRWLGDDEEARAAYTQPVGLIRAEQSRDSSESHGPSSCCGPGHLPVAHLSICCQNFREERRDQRCALRTISAEDAWHERLKTTGVSGRLVMYKKGELPREDISLHSRNGRILVSTVSMGGKACRAGVRPGDVLVSIDGRKDFTNKRAEEVQASLEAPVLLVFIGFVGKLEAEVQLNHPKAACGLSLGHEFVVGRTAASVQVIDEVIFEPISPLFGTGDDEETSINDDTQSSYDRSSSSRLRLNLST